MAEENNEKFNLYVKIRQFFQPYWRPMPKALKETLKNKNKPSKKGKVTKSESSNTNQATNNSQLPFKPASLTVKRANQSLNGIFKAKQFPEKGTAYYYHDNKTHQVIAHLGAEDRKKHSADERSDEERKSLKALLYPKMDKAYDRTHILPFGYIGTENDPRFVVGWSSEHNRNDLNDFEIRQSNLGEDIYWFTSINKVSGGAVWKTYIVSVESNKLLDSLELKIGSTSHPVEFYWKDGNNNE